MHLQTLRHPLGGPGYPPKFRVECNYPRVQSTPLLTWYYTKRANSGWNVSLIAHFIFENFYLSLIWGNLSRLHDHSWNNSSWVFSEVCEVRFFCEFLRSCVRTDRLLRKVRRQGCKVFERNARKRSSPPEISKPSCVSIFWLRKFSCDKVRETGEKSEICIC